MPPHLIRKAFTMKFTSLLNQPLSVLASAVLATTLLAAAPAAQAQSFNLVQTSTPTGGAIGANSLSDTAWLAERFETTGNVRIDSVMTYLLSDDAAGDLGKSFTLALYADVNNLPGLNFNATNDGKLFQASATYNGDGWNGLSQLNWQLGAGKYWLAVEAGSGANNAGWLLAPVGAQPATNVALYSGGQRYAAIGSSDTFGLAIVATPVPEPTGLALMLASLGALSLVARRRA